MALMVCVRCMRDFLCRGDVRGFVCGFGPLAQNQCLVRDTNQGDETINYRRQPNYLGSMNPPDSHNYSWTASVRRHQEKKFQWGQYHSRTSADEMPHTGTNLPRRHRFKNDSVWSWASRRSLHISMNPVENCHMQLLVASELSFFSPLGHETPISLNKQAPTNQLDYGPPPGVRYYIPLSAVLVPIFIKVQSILSQHSQAWGFFLVLITSSIKQYYKTCSLIH